MTVSTEASNHTRFLWPDTPEGALAHAVWSTIISDLGYADKYDEMMELWGAGPTWYIEGFGIDRDYLTEMLHKWFYIGEGSDILIDLAEREVPDGDKICKGCKETKPLTEFDWCGPRRHQSECKVCASERRRKK